ncbi:MAG: cell division protein ZapA [Pseudomonadota bacterium]|nr:cell division protein ZapA [Pseudomonadota bacterium]
MAQVTVTVNGRSHTIGCDEGEEARVRELAAFVDKRALELARSIGTASESRVLLMTALLIADDLAVCYEDIERLRKAAAGISPAGQRAGEVADRLEALTARLESALAAPEGASATPAAALD